MFANFLNWLQMQQYVNPVHRRTAYTMVIYALAVQIITLVIFITVATGASPADDLPIDVLYMSALVISGAVVLYTIHIGQRELAIYSVAAAMVLMPLVALLYENPGWPTVSSIYWVNIILLSILGDRRATVLTGAVMIAITGSVALFTNEAADSTDFAILFGVVVQGFATLLGYLVAGNLDYIAKVSIESEASRRLRLNQISNQVVTSVFARTEIDQLLTNVVEDIRARFDEIYHAQVFLIDDEGQYAVLQSSTGVVGRQLIERGHRLAVGSQSVIGRVTQVGDFVLAGDTSNDPVHKQNELLPDTRTELALPLRVEGGNIIGALDLQSLYPNAFLQEDIETFQVLADQLALAIDNARLLRDVRRQVEDNARLLQAEQTNRREIERLNSELTARAWQGLAPKYMLQQQLDLRTGITTAFTTLTETLATATSFGELVVYEDAGHQTIALPIKSNNVVIGALEFELESDEPLDLSVLTALEAVGERTGLALENARLFEETQNALSEIERLYEMAQVVNATADTDLQTIFDIVSDRLVIETNLERVAVLQTDPAASYQTSNLVVSYWWDRAPEVDSEWQEGWHVGQKLDYLRRGFGATVEANPSESILINAPIDAKDPVQQVLADIVVALEASTVLLLPLVSGGRWFGLLICASGKANAFEGGFVNFAQAAANQLATAIDNRRLLTEVQNEARRALALAEAGQAVTVLAGELSEGVSRLFRAVSGPGEFDRWWFGVLEKDGRTLRMISSATSSKTDESFPGVLDIHQTDNAITEVVHAPQVILVDSYDEEHPILGAISAEEAHLYGKHLVVPVTGRADELRGVLMVGRDIDDRNLDERDIQLATTLANQLAIAVENQSLFTAAESQRQTLRDTIATMPAGVVIFDPTGTVTLANDQAVELLGGGITSGLFNEKTYTVYDVNTNNPHDQTTFPTTIALEQNRPTTGHNFYIMTPNGHRRDILVSTALVNDIDASVTSVVAIFQDITDLRELEIALQSSLSETTALYEASRAIASSPTKNELITAIVNQLATLSPNEIYVLFREGQDETELQTELVAYSPNEAGLDLPTENFDNLTLPPELLTYEEPLIGDLTSEQILGVLDDALREKLDGNKVQSVATLPLQVRGNQTIGWLTLAYHTPHTFAAEERRFLATLADQVAVQLNVNRLFTGTQTALRSVANLYRGNKRIASAKNIAEATGVVHEEVQNFSPDRIDLILQQSLEDSGDLKAVIGWTDDRSLTDIPSLPIDPVTLRPQTTFDIMSDDAHYVEDVQASSDDALGDALLALDTPYQAVVSVPVRAAGRPLGRLTLGFLQPRRFLSDDVQFIGMLADSLAYIVSNELLFQQTQDSLEETGVLYQASRAIANADDREAIVQALIDFAASAVVDKVMLITLVSEAWDSPDAQIEVASTWGRGDFLDLKGLRFTPIQLPIWQELSATDITWSDDVENDPDMDEFTRLGFRTLDVASYIIVPLRTPTGPIGAIMLGSSQTRTHHEREIRIYRNLADQAAVQLENKRLLEQADVRTRQLQISAQVAQAATQILDLDELFPQIVQLIQEQFNYDHAQIFMVDDQRENAVLRAATGEAGRQMLAVRHSLPIGSQSVVGQATVTGEYFLVSDTSESDAMHRPNPYLPETRAELAIPLKVKGTIRGAIDVQSNRPGAFTVDDIRALTSLANQLAIAIDNAELFQISSQRASDMGFLYDVTSTAASAGAGLNETLETLGTVLIKQMNALGVELYLYEEEEELLRSELAIVSETSDTGTEYNFIDTADNVPLGHGIIGWVARHLRPLIIQDFRQEEEYFPSLARSRSGVFVPLASGEALIGVLGIEGANPYQYNQEDMRLLQALSSTLTPILQNARLVDELQQTNKRLREIDKLKTNFLAAMSHELRTPLNSIIGFSRVILKGIDGPITDMQSQDIQTIHDSGKHLLGLVNDILDQAKIEAGKMELVQEYFDVGGVVKSLMASAQGLTKDKPIQLFMEIEDGLPEGYGDEFRTRQIILNLIGNAAKFTKEGSITLSCYSQFDAEIGQKIIVVGVNDTGKGIAAEDIDNIFESFQQVDNSTTRAEGGTGLGLPLARSLAELQGGRLLVESEVGVGSTFFVHLLTEPTRVEDEADATELTAQTSRNGKLDTVQLDTGRASNGGTLAVQKPATSELKRRVILAIDDEVGMINLYRRYLSKEGWQIIGETDPQRTEEMIAAHSPQIVLLDINMPTRNGWDILENLQQSVESDDLPVIVCSIETDSERSAQLGAIAHITKPFDEQTLVEAVRQVQSGRLTSNDNSN
jgi:PAS domain S-box-containing protein